MEAFKYFACQLRPKLVSAKTRLELWQTFFKSHIMYGLEAFFVDEATLNQIKRIYSTHRLKEPSTYKITRWWTKCSNSPLDAGKQHDLQTDLDYAVHHPALQARVRLTRLSICEDRKSRRATQQVSIPTYE